MLSYKGREEVESRRGKVYDIVCKDEKDILTTLEDSPSRDHTHTNQVQF